jgi:acyl-CoA dehydrogenase
MSPKLTTGGPGAAIANHVGRAKSPKLRLRGAIMDFTLNDEQKTLVETIRGFIASELAPLEGEIELTGVLAPEKAAEIHAKSSALGLYAMNIPEEFGGGGLGAVDQMLLEEQFGRTTDILIRRASGNVYEMLLKCQGAQIDRWLIRAS